MALFQRRHLRAKPEDQKFGLVVGPPAIVIMKKGGKVDGVWQPDQVLFDGLAEMEREYRTKGRTPVTFEDDDTDGSPFN
jgi:hypothetical protein